MSTFVSGPQPGRSFHHPVEHGLYGPRHPVPAWTGGGHSRQPAPLSGTPGLATHQPHRRLSLGRTGAARQGWLQDAQSADRTPHNLMFPFCPLSVVFRPFYVVTPNRGFPPYRQVPLNVAILVCSDERYVKITFVSTPPSHKDNGHRSLINAVDIIAIFIFGILGMVLISPLLFVFILDNDSMTRLERILSFVLPPAATISGMKAH
jgi:hypothetical protein